MAALRSLLAVIAVGVLSPLPLGASPPVLTGGSGRVKEAVCTVAGKLVTVNPIQNGNGMSLPGASAAKPVKIVIDTPGKPMFAVFSVAEVDVTEGRREVPGTFKLFVIPCGKDEVSQHVEFQRGRVYKIVTQKLTLWLNVANN